MNHLSQEELVLSYYGELGNERHAHLEQCRECIAELASLAAVLDRVTPVDVPEPADDYESRVWSRLQWRLRGDVGRASARPSREGGLKPALHWAKAVGVAATVIIAFLAGVLWKSSNRVVESTRIATATTTSSATPVSTTGSLDASKTRILLVVVGDHFDESERVLVELANLTPDGNTDISAERKRAEDLISDNRIYRTTALERGEEDVATLLDELEPVLMQIAHAPEQVSADELRAMQKRVETKGLVFKLRVVRADVKRTAAATPTSI